MIDGHEADDKIIAVLEADLAFGRISEIRDVPQGLIDRLKHYFLSYKQLPSDPEKKVEIVDVYDRVEAQDVITRSLRDYEEEFAADSRG
jgi:inorganic pyrophosphatase